MLAKFQGRINELENLNARQQKLIQDFEARHILYFIEIERLNLINNDLQEQIANFKEEINKLKSVIYMKFNH